MLFKKIGRILKGVGKAVVHDILPIPEIRNIMKGHKLKQGAERLRNFNSTDLRSIADLLDDGKINDSVDDAKYESIARAITSVGGLITLIIYIITEIF